MRWVILSVLAVLCVVFILLLRTPSDKSLPAPAPDFTLPDLQGQAVRLSQLKGKVVFLNIWTTWCPPCRKEMPTMETLYQRLKNEDFVMLATSQDVDGQNTVAPYLREWKLTFPVLIDTSGSVGRTYGVTGYPETFLINRQGDIVYHHIGYNDWARSDVEQAIRRLITRGEWVSPSSSTRGEQTPLKP